MNTEETLANHWGPVTAYAMWQCGGCGHEYLRVPYPLPTTQKNWTSVAAEARALHAEHQATLLERNPAA